MTLITDGGSTKCDWVLLNAAGEVVFKTTTLGLNPTVIPKKELTSIISENESLRKIFLEVEKLDFYGAGCGTSSPRSILSKVLNLLFPNAVVNVFEDMVAAVFAVTTQPGIVCILGTGSNSCFYDGEKILNPIPALGFVLMDEASGNYYGKKLIRDFYYHRMPSQIAKNFSEKHNLSADSIKMNLYTKANPTAYLASFGEFIFTQEQLHPYFHNMIKEGIMDFIECRILCYETASQVPVHFIGSIAHFSKSIIKECFEENNLILGNIIRKPIEGLIEHYKRNILC